MTDVIVVVVTNTNIVVENVNTKSMLNHVK